MYTALIAFPGVLLLVASFQSALAGPNDRIIQSGETVVYDTVNGPILLDNLEIQAGARLLVRGPNAFRLYARKSIRIDGTLDLSGSDHPGVFTLNTPNQPELGAKGGPAGGSGGTGSSLTTSATPAGLNGFGSLQSPSLGGGGGESGFNANTSQAGAFRRAAGGGGGVFGPPELVVPDVEDPQNMGRVSLAGMDGAAQALGALSGTAPPQGGGVGSAVFQDSSTQNDFFGRKVLSGGGFLMGELAAPQAGQGGGAGGDAVASGVFPPATFVHSQHDKGCGGGGGGGLGVLISRNIVFGPQGLILADGGAGGSGENTSFLNHIGGGSGAGSGGMIALQAARIDLSQASDVALSALGGEGGRGADDVSRAEGGGGHGGPGLIQLHVPDGDPAKVLLPSGVSLAGLSAPGAHVLMLEPSL